MKISRIKIAKLIGDTTLKTKPTPKFIDEIAAYLLTTKRTIELDSIMRDVSVYRATQGVIEANVVSAFPISAKVKSDIKTKVKQIYPNAKQIIMTDQIDKTIISGIRVELPNEFIDLTVKTKLNRFKQLTVLGKGF